jgi:hypothetical protein
MCQIYRRAPFRPVDPTSDRQSGRSLRGGDADMIRNTPVCWGSVARSFHWILGFVIIGMIAYGWWMNHFPAGVDRFFYRSIHADIGYVVLLLMVLRVIWRAITSGRMLDGAEG